jgi:putative glycosyltransferase (TIGR04372 family)
MINFIFLYLKNFKKKNKFYLKKLGFHVPYNFLSRNLKNLFGYFFAYSIIFFIKIFYPNDRIVCNMFWGSVGHLSVEADYFLLKMSKLKKTIKVIIFCPNHPNNQFFLKNFKKYFRFTFSNNFLFKYINLISPKYKKNFLDSALSDIRFHYQKKNDRRPYNEVAKLYNKYFILKKKQNLFPFLDISYESSNLDFFLKLNDIKKKEYAVIHIKELEGNACALRTSAHTYVETIKYLNSIGLKVVFGGRELMPEIFKELNVINFANSNFAKSYTDDLNLIINSSFVLGFASGFMCMLDILNVPGVACGFWNIMIPIYSEKIVFLPTILQSKSGRYLTFKEQMKLIEETQCDFSLIKNIIPINPTSSEILLSTKQALKKIELSKDYYFLNTKFKNQFKKLPIYYSQCQISEVFLKNNKDKF